MLVESCGTKRQSVWQKQTSIVVQKKLNKTEIILLKIDNAESIKSLMFN